MARQTSFRDQLGWVVPVLLGLATVVVCGVVYRATHRPISPRIVDEARALSIDASQLNDVSQLDTKLFEKKPLTADEWSRYKAYATGSNLVFKRKLARHLSATLGSKYEPYARSIVKELIRDADPQTRANALISLRKFDDPSWREVARQFLTDPAVPPRQMGATFLEQDGKK